MSQKHTLVNESDLAAKKPKISNYSDEDDEYELDPTKENDTPKLVFDPLVDGCTFTDMSDEQINTEKLIAIGYSYQSKFDTKRKEFNVHILYVRDNECNIGELVLYDKLSQSMKIAQGAIVEVKNFSVEKQSEESMSKISIRNLSQIEVLDKYKTIDLMLNVPNTLDELNYTYSNCQLKFVAEKEQEERNGCEVKSLEFETLDKKRVQLSFWGSNAIYSPSEKLNKNKIYSIVNATKNMTHPTFFDICLTGHAVTLIEETDIIDDGIDEEEKGELHPISSFISFNEKDLMHWRKGRFIAISESVINTKHHDYTIGISDETRDADNNKIIAMAASYDTGLVKIKKGDRFECNIKVTVNDSNSYHGALHNINIISEKNAVGKSKYMPKHMS